MYNTTWNETRQYIKSWVGQSIEELDPNASHIRDIEDENGETDSEHVTAMKWVIYDMVKLRKLLKNTVFLNS